MRTAIATAAAALALAAPAAQAHITVQPSEAPAGGFTRLDVRVPHDRDDAATVEVALQLPPGVAFVSYEPVPGWDVEVDRERLEDPIETEDGFEIDEQVARVTWSGGRIGPGEFQDFGLSVAIPDGEPGDELTFKALQTYQGGEVVRWIGPADGDEPAPILTLTAPAEGGGHGAPGAPAADGESTPAPAEPASSAPAAAADEGDGATLAVAALLVGALALFAALAALFTRNRAPKEAR